MQAHITLPPDLLTLTGLLSPARAAQHALRQALDQELRPVPVAAGAKSHPVYVTPEVFAGLIEAGGSADDIGLIAAGVIEAWATQARTERMEPVADPLANLPHQSLRPQQRELLLHALPALRAGRVAFCEASTGVGKSWVIALAAEAARQAGHRTLIAAPTLAILAQLIDAFHRLGLHPPVPLLGRSQFIDPARLQLVLDQTPDLVPDDQRQALASWDGAPLEAGVLAPLARAAGALQWLRDDAIALAPDLPIELVQFADGDQIQSQAAQRELGQAAPVLVTTHAMVAADLRMRSLQRPLLPDFDWLVLDEAHLFEETVASVFSDGLSVFALRHRLAAISQEQAKSLRVAAAIDRVMEATAAWMQDFREADKRSFLFGTRTNAQGSDARVEFILRDGAVRLLPDIQKLIRAEVPGLDLAGVQRALQGIVKSSLPVSLTLSPVRRFPSVHVGHPGIKKRLADLWERCKAVMLVSATLYVDTQEHGRSAGFLGSRLAVPMGRMAEIPPVVASWLYSTASLHLPDEQSSLALIPPPKEEFADPGKSAEEGRFHDELTKVVRLATVDAAGGTLVLCTSYSTVAALKRRLDPDLHDRLLVQQTGETINALRLRFRAMFDAGLRPIWLATGAAGTGLDLRDERVHPEKDRLLTDLVITRLPLFPPSSLMSELRRERMGISALRLELAFTFRQWLGRAVRAEGQPDRRIWVCDGRLSDKQHQYLTGPCRRILLPYERQVHFALVGK